MLCTSINKNNDLVIINKHFSLELMHNSNG